MPVIGQTLKVVKPLVVPPYRLEVGQVVIAVSTDFTRIALPLTATASVTLPALTTATQRACLSEVV